MPIIMPEHSFSHSVNNDMVVEIIYQNIRSMRQNFDSFLIQLQTLGHLPKILILSEIWINNNESQFYQIENYNLKLKCNEEYRAGGVAVYIHTSLEIIDSNIITMTSADVLKIKIKLNNEFLNIFAIYRTHRFNREMFINELDNYFSMSNNLKAFKNVLLIGDININLLEHSDVVDKYKQLLAISGASGLVNEPTRITEQSQTCLDHVYVKLANCNMIDLVAEVLDANITDHCMIRVNVTVQGRGEEANRFPPSGNAQRIDCDILNECLKNVDWSGVYIEQNASKAYDIFHSILLLV